MAADDWVLFKLKITKSEIQMTALRAINVPLRKQKLLVESFYGESFFLLHIILWTPCATYKD